MKIRDRIKELRRVKASELFASPHNWREHPQTQQDALRGILEEVGYADALLARELPDGSLEIVDGHLRKETTPDQEVPVLILDIDEDEAKKLLAVFDPLAAMAEANTDALGQLLAEIGTESDGLQAMLDELASENGIDLFADGPEDIVEPEPQVDRAAELQKEWGTETGQLWVIPGKAGEHRLLCGDSTKAADVGRVMGEAKADLLLADPPYGVGWHTPDGPTRSKVESVIGDDTPFDPVPFLSLGKIVVLWGANHYASKLPDTASWLVWDKRPTEWQNDQSDCELAWMNTGGTARVFRKSWGGGGCLAAENGVANRRIHATQKPVALMVWCIEKSECEGIILDPFLGSGTTMVAAEQLGRICYGLEISPAYCAVILQRMKDMGLEPRLDS